MPDYCLVLAAIWGVGVVLAALVLAFSSIETWARLGSMGDWYWPFLFSALWPLMLLRWLLNRFLC